MMLLKMKSHYRYPPVLIAGLLAVALLFCGELAQAQGRQAKVRVRDCGSAVVVSAEGFLVTSAHLIAKAERVVVVRKAGIWREETAVQVVDVDAKANLALLKINGKGIASLPLAPASPVSGTPAWPFGFQLCNDNSTARQEACRWTETGVQRMHPTWSMNIASRDLKNGALTLSSPLNHGNDGCPLVNARGDIVGIVDLRRSGWGIKRAGATDVAVVRKFLTHHKVRFASGGAPLDLKLDELSKRVAPAVMRIAVVPKRRPDKTDDWEQRVLQCGKKEITKSWAPLAVSRDGTRLAAGGDGGICLYDTVSLRKEHTLPGQGGRLIKLMFSPDGRRLIGLADTKKGVILMSWRVDTGVLWNRLEIPQAFTMDVSPDGKLLAVGAKRPGSPSKKYIEPARPVQIYDLSTGKLKLSIDPLTERIVGATFAVRFMPKTGRLLIAGNYCRIKPPDDKPSGQGKRKRKDAEKRRLKAEQRALVNAARSATVRPNICVQIWDASTGKLLHVPTLSPQPPRFSDFTSGVRAPNLVAVSPDETTFSVVTKATVSEWSTYLYDLGTGRLRFDLGNVGTRAASVAFSPSGRLLAINAANGSFQLAGGFYREIRLHDAASGMLLWRLKGDGGRAFAFSPDASGLYQTVNRKGLIANSHTRIWDLAGFR